MSIVYSVIINGISNLIRHYDSVYVYVNHMCTCLYWNGEHMHLLFVQYFAKIFFLSQ